MEAGVSFALRNAIIPNAVDWFTGEAEDEDDEDDEEGACDRSGWGWMGKLVRGAAHCWSKNS